MDGLWLLVLVLTVAYVHLQTRLTHLQEGRQAASAQVCAMAVQPKPRVVPPYQEALAALRRAALPEADTFAELEHAAVVGIRLRSIDDNPAASSVTVELDAISDAVLIDDVDPLNAGMPVPTWHNRRTAELDGRGSASGATAVDFKRGATIYREIWSASSVRCARCK